MSSEQISETDPRIESALGELCGMIQQRWPAATFEVSRGDDPEGIYLDATVDIEDTDEVMDVVVPRLLEMQVDEELPVYVIPLRPIERVVEEMRAVAGSRPQSRRSAALGHETVPTRTNPR